MPLPNELFETASNKFEKRVRSHGRLIGWRKRLARRESTRPHFDRGWEFLLVHRPPLDKASERRVASDTIQGYLKARSNDEDESERFGFVPIWVFAIVLKVIASVLIDLWLLHAPQDT